MRATSKTVGIDYKYGYCRWCQKLYLYAEKASSLCLKTFNYSHKMVVVNNLLNGRS